MEYKNSNTMKPADPTSQPQKQNTTDASEATR